MLGTARAALIIVGILLAATQYSLASGGVLLGLYGEPVPNASFFVSEPLITIQGVAPKSSFTLPEPAPKQYDSEKVRQLLNHLMSWDSANAYRSYFLLMPRSEEMINLIARVKADVMGQPTPGASDVPIPFQLDKPEWSIKARYVKEIVSDNNAFRPNSADPNFDRSNAIFLRLDGFANLVPGYVAGVAEGAFINGLVTRLFLGQYVKILNQYGLKLSPSDLNLSSAFSLSALGGDLFVKPGSWPANVGYKEALNTLLRDNPVQPTAILYGWRAGDELSKPGSEQFVRDVWQLLSYRFTIRDIGTMVAYTLNYLTGYTENGRIRDIVKGNANTPPVNKDQLFQKVSDELQKTLASSQNRLLTVSVFNVVLSEFYALSKNKNGDSTLLAQYKSFLEGFEVGSSRASDEIYRELFELAYGLGYADGFRDGYIKGYADGYRDGNVVWFWSGMVDVLGGLSSAFAGINSVISGVGSFLDKVGLVVGPVVSAVGWIASLF